MSSIPPQPSAAAGRGVWIAVFVMGAVIVALLAAVLFKLTQPASGNAPTASAALAEASPPAQSASPARGTSGSNALNQAVSAAALTTKPVVEAPRAPSPEQKAQIRQATIAAQPAPAPAAQVTNTAPQQFAPQQFAPAQQAQVPPAPQAAVCATCGTIVAVAPQQVQSQQTNPLGVIAGGVVGGLLGNQVGGGSGRTAATVIGAIGGGIAGNEIAKKVDTQTIYNVQVRMDDGRVRTLQLKVAPPVGQRVQIGPDGGLNPM